MASATAANREEGLLRIGIDPTAHVLQRDSGHHHDEPGLGRPPGCGDTRRAEPARSRIKGNRRRLQEPAAAGGLHVGD